MSLWLRVWPVFLSHPQIAVVLSGFKLIISNMLFWWTTIYWYQSSEYWAYWHSLPHGKCWNKAPKGSAAKLCKTACHRQAGRRFMFCVHTQDLCCVSQHRTFTALNDSAEKTCQVWTWIDWVSWYSMEDYFLKTVCFKMLYWPSQKFTKEKYSLLLLVLSYISCFGTSAKLFRSFFTESPL